MKIDYKRQIMAFLFDTGPDGGAYTTGDIAAHVQRFGHNNRIHSAFVRQKLLELERDGLVQKADNQKPALWQKASQEPTNDR